MERALLGQHSRGLGDFLIAQELLSGMQPGDFRTACMTNGRLAPYFGSQEKIANTEGIISALSILVPEQFAKGTELPDLFDEGPVKSAVLKVAVSSYLWRDPASFTAASGSNLRKALGRSIGTYRHGRRLGGVQPAVRNRRKLASRLSS